MEPFAVAIGDVLVDLPFDIMGPGMTQILTLSSGATVCPSPGEVCHSLYEFDVAIGVSCFIDILFGHFGEIHRK